MKAGTWATAATAAALVGLAEATLVERRRYRLRHVTVPALAVPDARPLRILHVSDLHLHPGAPHLAAFLRRCARAEPDLVVATGDFLGHPDSIEPAVELLGDLAAGRPAVAVLGSHDVYADKPKNPLRYLVGRDHRVHGPPLDTTRFMGALRARGWHILDNARATVETDSGPVEVAGLSDPHEGWDRPELLDGGDTAAPELLDGGDTAAPVLRLGVVHAPYLRALAALGDRGCDLVLAGHTHGGQLRVPGMGPLVANCDLPLGRARGLSRGLGSHADGWLHVSAGVGESVYAPVRFACPREATVLEVVAPAFEPRADREYPGEVGGM